MCGFGFRFVRFVFNLPFLFGRIGMDVVPYR